MQTNREDCGDRYREIILPKPRSPEWADKAAGAFATYFKAIGAARDAFIEHISDDGFEYVANVRAVALIDAASEAGEAPEDVEPAATAVDVAEADN